MIRPGPVLASVLPVVASSVAILGQEYGALEVTLEVVGSVNEAVEHINTYGSGHTDCIVTEDGMIIINDVMFFIMDNFFSFNSRSFHEFCEQCLCVS